MSTKPGERKTQILQMLAEMLEQPHAARITTAALAARLQVSEAALYRHFASKAQMFEGLIEFIETTLFTLINQIASAEPQALPQTRKTVSMLLAFAERNRGITRVLTGDALVTEDNRLQERINHINDRIEATLKQCLRNAVSEGSLPAQANVAAHASLLTHLVMGRWLRYAQSGWRVAPTMHLEEHLRLALP
ncbi:nucleoid occlusion factor SlmA [Bordetella holmesii]|uniref:Transcriptional regulator, TetR family n=2 Tax=Bordetella holmesii TaxID=35814 RepID=A0A158M6V8_9BORD|nr:nucleoid occlusion factor SlmA [Bordetella holmesii]AHV92999.1 bacterial regulatory s, tetR family protein [Bordetella holmesii ATCC 51541]AIT26470.1 bacterial regulatory s, tetR family protein [Bordetella holmesii 44057]EWM40200.1 bacterial regulatory s, tetR family protein [Bordetella holmesii 35009]EWM43081.1 bacterial regulatory s, tetR family protein [Bordetella holmesii 41130]EWM51212.1 bacterial regulatory s, tetR family protein [Bordetella holmesii 70147]